MTTDGFFYHGAWIDYSELTYNYDKYRNYLCCPTHNLMGYHKPNNYDPASSIEPQEGSYCGLTYAFCYLKGDSYPIKIESHKSDLPPHLQSIIPRPRWCPLKETK